MKTSLIACVLTLCIVFCDAQTPHFLKHNLPSEFKSAEITSILQSRTGFIWLGTSQGLLRYDGFSFKVFSEIADSAESISCLYEDSKGVLWTGQRNGRIS